MTGTPLDLTPFGDVLTAIGWLFWLLVLGLLVVAWWLPKLLWQKIAAVAIVVAVFYIVVVRPLQVRIVTEQAQRENSKSRLDESMALFKERCKGAGEKIARTVENVDGVVWMKWREEGTNNGDQFKLDDPYGKDCRARGCIEKLLRATLDLQLDPQRKHSFYAGYRYVESVDPSDGQWYRFTLRVAEPYPKLEQARIDKPTARYGITWEDVSTRDDREQWIAGGSLKVIDLETNQVVAERLGYMRDRGLGSTSGFRSPWLFARESACPASVDQDGKFTRTGFTERFAFKVLHPQQGE